MLTQYTKSLEEKERRVRAIFISSYIPRKCGIATFTKDLTNAINVLNPRNLAEIMAVNDNNYDYPWEVKFRINQDDLKNYLSAAEYINNSSAEVVCLEHEFGLFGGKDGDYIVSFLKQLKKPVVTTFHTVPDHPTESQKSIITRVSSLSQANIVMIDSIVDRLIHIYGVDRKKIVVIPHGVPDISFGGKEHFKRILRLRDKFLLSTVNLISPNKGIEYLIEPIPEIIQEVPNFLYLVIGETHPVVKKKSDEEYRKRLINMVKKLKVQKHVRFINRYIPLEELIMYLRATDVYATPYLDPGQVASGTLSYAVGAGKASISTPYIYAQDILNGDRGILVPFRNSKAIARAIIDLYSNPKKRSEIERKAYEHGRFMTWPSVALAYLDLFKLVLSKQRVRSSNEKSISH